MKIEQITEKWSQKYKKSIDCSNPKGFSQKAHCAGRKKKKNEDVVERELTKFEKRKMKSYEKKIDKKDFIDRYGKEKGEPYYYATITKMAKNASKKNESVPKVTQPKQKTSKINRELRNKEIIKDLNDIIKDLNPNKKEIEIDPEDYREKYKKFKQQGKPFKITKVEEGKRIPRKKGQPAGSKKHSDLYTDENPKGTIHGLKFATVADAKASVSKIRNSGKSHAHKIQAAVAMEQRAKAAGKVTAAGVYRTFINAMKKKTKKKNESTYETKEAPPGHYFTKSGNLVKGTLTKDAKERGARQTDPKDKSRSKIPAVTQYNENYVKSIYTGNYIRKPDQLKGTTKFKITATPGEKESPHPARGILVGSKMSEGVNDPHIFKAVFMAGGPGSGKSFVAQKLLGGTGLRPVNSDEVYEYLLKRQGLTLGPDDIASDKGQEIRGTAKDLTDKRQQNYIDGRLGLIIDGTGKVPELIKKLVDKLKSIGYSVSMIFVNTSLEVAQQRNLERERTLPADIVEKSWRGVQDNLMQYQQIFGADRFHIVDNSGGLEDIDRQKNFDKVYNEIQRFINTPPKHKNALAWIQNQKAQNNAKQTTNSTKSDGGVTDTN